VNRKVGYPLHNSSHASYDPLLNGGRFFGLLFCMHIFQVEALQTFIRCLPCLPVYWRTAAPQRRAENQPALVKTGPSTGQQIQGRA